MNSFFSDSWELTEEDQSYFNRLTEAIVQTKIAEYLSVTPSVMQTESDLKKKFEHNQAAETTKTYDLVGEGYAALMEGLPRHLQELPKYETKKIEEEVDRWTEQLINITSYSAFMEEIYQKNLSLQAAFKLSNETVFTFYQVARDYVHTRELRKALSLFYFLIQLSPATYEFWLGLAACYFDLGFYQEAIPPYLKAKELRDDDPTFDLFIAECYLALNDPSLAEIHLHEAKEKLDNSPNYYVLRPLSKELLKKVKMAKKTVIK